MTVVKHKNCPAFLQKPQVCPTCGQKMHRLGIETEKWVSAKTICDGDVVVCRYCNKAGIYYGGEMI
jgi:hypothetical protein